jgi:hypothetical protein
MLKLIILCTVPQPSTIPEVLKFADRRLGNVHSHSWFCPYNYNGETPGDGSTFQ